MLLCYIYQYIMSGRLLVGGTLFHPLLQLPVVCSGMWLQLVKASENI